MALNHHQINLALAWRKPPLPHVLHYQINLLKHGFLQVSPLGRNLLFKSPLLDVTLNSSPLSAAQLLSQSNLLILWNHHTFSHSPPYTGRGTSIYKWLPHCILNTLTVPSCQCLAQFLLLLKCPSSFYGQMVFKKAAQTIQCGKTEYPHAEVSLAITLHHI